MDEQTRSIATVSPTRATAIVGLGSVLTLALSVLVTKVFAILIGPTGVGQLGLLLSTLNIATIVAGVGLSTTVVRRVAASQLGSRISRREVAAVAMAAATGLVGGLAMAGARSPIASFMLGSSAHAPQVALLGLALILSVVSSVLIAILTGRHQVRTATLISIATGLTSAVVGIPLVGLFGVGGLTPMIALTALAQLLFAAWALRGRIARPTGQQLKMFKEAASLVSEGAPVSLSQLVGQGVQLAIPIAVLHLLGSAQVGLYRAAAAVSIGYLTFFLATLSQDFYPRLSAASGRHEGGIAVERRMRLLMGLGGPLIVAMLAASPFLIQLLYSGAFEPAAGILRWQLTGDLLRLPAWVLGFVLLASGRMVRYFLVELANGAVLLFMTLVGIERLGLEGAGIGYAAAQLVHLLLLWLVLRDVVDTRPGRLQLALVGIALGSAIVIAAGLPQVIESVIFAVTAAVLAALAWPRLLALQRQGLL